MEIEAEVDYRSPFGQELFELGARCMRGGKV
jgi:hypothetical protein